MLPEGSPVESQVVGTLRETIFKKLTANGNKKRKFETVNAS